MRLQFDPNQEYQIEAIKAVTDIFEGQPLSKSDYKISLYTSGFFSSIQGVANQISLSDEQILKNVRSIQEKNDLDVSETLERHLLVLTIRIGH